jgi:hypothetical protein
MLGPGPLTIKRFMMIDGVKVEVDEKNRPLASQRQSNNSSNSQKFDNYTAQSPTIMGDGRTLSSQSVQSNSAAYLAPPTRIMNTPNTSSTYQTSGERILNKVQTSSVSQQLGSQAQNYTGSQYRQNIQESSLPKNARYSSGSNYGLQTVEISH